MIMVAAEARVVTAEAREPPTAWEQEPSAIGLCPIANSASMMFVVKESGKVFPIIPIRISFLPQ